MTHVAQRAAVYVWAYLRHYSQLVDSDGQWTIHNSNVGWFISRTACLITSRTVQSDGKRQQHLLIRPKIAYNWVRTGYIQIGSDSLVLISSDVQSIHYLL